jgi:hypothetical protein
MHTHTFYYGQAMEEEEYNGRETPRDARGEEGVGAARTDLVHVPRHPDFLDLGYVPDEPNSSRREPYVDSDEEAEDFTHARDFTLVRTRPHPGWESDKVYFSQRRYKDHHDSTVPYTRIRETSGWYRSEPDDEIGVQQPHTEQYGDQNTYLSRLPRDLHPQLQEHERHARDIRETVWFSPDADDRSEDKTRPIRGKRTAGDERQRVDIGWWGNTIGDDPLKTGARKEWKGYERNLGRQLHRLEALEHAHELAQREGFFAEENRLQREVEEQRAMVKHIRDHEPLSVRPANLWKRQRKNILTPGASGRQIDPDEA